MKIQSTIINKKHAGYILLMYF